MVANFDVEGRPVLLGDLLLSMPDDGREYARLPIPFNFDLNRELRSKNHTHIVCGLDQKLILLSPHLAVAWTGLLSEAEIAIRELAKHVDTAGHDADALNSFFELHRTKRHHLYLTGITLECGSDGKTLVRKFAFRFSNGRDKERTSARFGQCFVAGSGAEDFTKLLDFAEVNRLNLKGSRNCNPCENAVFVALTLAAQLSGEQARTGSGLAKLYGGGYEIMTLFDNELRKVGEIAYHLYEAKLEKDGAVTIDFHQIIKYSYANDNLLIRRLLLAKPPELCIDDLFVILPLHKRPSDEEKVELERSLSRPSFDSIFYVFYIHILQAKPEGRIAQLIYYRGKDGAPPIRILEEQDAFEISEELRERIISVVQRRVSG